MVGLAGGPGPAEAARGLELGLADDSFLAPGAGLRDDWMDRAERAGADLVLLNVRWSGVAPPTRPAEFEPSDPEDPAYDWTALDGAVRSALAHGFRPVLTIKGAPAWAEGSGRPSFRRAPAGTWMPRPRQLGLFARAVATRYPQVRYFEIWAEQNLDLHLTPLWRGNRLVAPSHYRAMLNAAYAGIHSAGTGARVIVGGLAPYGDLSPKGHRIPPVWFWRSLLCLKGARLQPAACPNPARFDIAAHNPIDVFGPSQGAVRKVDVSIPDIGRLTRIVHKAVRTGRALPAGPKPFWAPEIWWDSDPPDPSGVPLGLQARYLEQSLFILWRQGVGAVIWWYLRDQAPGTVGFAATQQSGLFFRDGRPKPAYRAFRFPFVGERESGGRILLWGKAPRSGELVVERRERGRWAPLTHLRAGRSRVFLGRIRAKGALRLRASQGLQRSLPWNMQ
jgi:hypothetical protein